MAKPKPPTAARHVGLANPRWMALLAAFATARSITAAAKAAGFSYKGAWDAVDAMNNLAGTALVATAVGGQGGGGARLTPRGQAVIAAYRAVEAENQRFAAQVKPRQRASAAAAAAKTLERIAWRTSARNQWTGVITAIEAGAVNDQVRVRLASGDSLVAMVTRDSTEALELAVGQEITALVKAPAVLVAPGSRRLKLSARNQFVGKVSRVVKGAVNAEVVIALGAGQSVTAIITSESARELGLVAGKAAVALFDASAVILALR